ncbi:enoyl-CoA-hydratase DpgB [Streptomyces xantholiticus]
MNSSGTAPTSSPDTALGVDSARPLSASLVAEINALCDRVEDSKESAAAVIRLQGTGPAADWPGDVGIDLVSRWEKALRRLERTSAAKIVTVEGVCRGPALEVLLTADYRIGGPGAHIDIPVHNGSVWTGTAVHRLVNQLGGARARRLILFGTELSAERALEIGLLDENTDDPAALAAELAERFGRLVPAEIAIRRELVLDAGVTGFEEMLGRHLAACDRMLRRARSDSASATR